MGCGREANIPQRIRLLYFMSILEYGVYWCLVLFWACFCSVFVWSCCFVDTVVTYS